MLHFEGDKVFAQALAPVWEALSDARFLVRCVPGVESTSDLEREAARCTLRPGFAFVRGTLDLALQVVPAADEKTIRVLIQTKGIGSDSAAEARLALAAEGTGTRVHWSADVSQLGGLLKAVPRGLIQAAAQKVISDAWELVSANLGPGG